METIYSDIAARTGGNIYIGVVGPVRTGKSTLVRRILEQLVIPAMEDPNACQRARDELPQSGSGRTIMTAEPKFVPEEAVEITPDGVNHLRVRLIDSVGYLVPGAVGGEEDGQPRMVCTPWADTEVPMAEAAELGTRKVMAEHCCIGLVVTTDGTITDLPRSAYEEAEARSIADMQATGKPFLVVINSADPGGEAARRTHAHLLRTAGVDSMIADLQLLDKDGVVQLLQQVLYRFPMTALSLRLPRWLDALAPDHPIKEKLYPALLEAAQSAVQVSQAESALAGLQALAEVETAAVQKTDLATGTVYGVVTLAPQLFHGVLSEYAGETIENDGKLLQLLQELSAARSTMGILQSAMEDMKATGFGLVLPDPEAMELQPAILHKKSGAYGVQLRAKAPAVCMLRLEVEAEIHPMAGTEDQARALQEQLSTPDGCRREGTLFGRSAMDLLQEDMNRKLLQTTPQIREKFRSTLNRVLNDPPSGMICILL